METENDRDRLEESVLFSDQKYKRAFLTLAKERPLERATDGGK